MKYISLLVLTATCISAYAMRHSPQAYVATRRIYHTIQQPSPISLAGKPRTESVARAIKRETSSNERSGYDFRKGSEEHRLNAPKNHKDRWLEEFHSRKTIIYENIYDKEFIRKYLPDFSQVPTSLDEWKKFAKKSLVAHRGFERYMELLLKNEKDLKSHNQDCGDALLLVAASHRDLTLVQALRECGLEYTANENNYTALHAACGEPTYDDNPELVEFLIHEGIPVNVQTKGRYPETALSLAVENRLAKSVTVLLKHQANPNLPTTLLHRALGDVFNSSLRRYKDLTIIKALVNAKADVNATNNDGDTALDFVYRWMISRVTEEKSKEIYQELVLLLRNNGANFKTTDPSLQMWKPARQ